MADGLFLQMRRLRGDCCLLLDIASERWAVQKARATEFGAGIGGRLENINSVRWAEEN